VKRTETKRKVLEKDARIKTKMKTNTGKKHCKNFLKNQEKEKDKELTQ
jgi:hypothetical protein